jgi:hypothetical protein
MAAADHDHVEAGVHQTINPELRAFYPTNQSRSKTRESAPWRLFHVKQPPLRVALLADAKVAEDHVENVFDIDPTGQPTQRPPGEPQFLRHHVLTDRQRLGEGAVQGCQRILQSVAVSCAGHQRGLAGAKKLLSVGSKRFEKFLESGFS